MNYEINKFTVKMVRESTIDLGTVINSESVVDVLESLGLRDAAEEYMYLICLNTKGDVIGVSEVSHGDLASAQIHPREVYKRAILCNAAGIICAHNHPSGNCTPSQEDIVATNRIADAGKLLGIQLVDHVIIGQDTHVSLLAEGYISRS